MDRLRLPLVPLTRGALVGPRYRRLFPDVYVSVGAEVDLALRSRGAALLVEPDGVLSGYSAAELLRASCGRDDAPAEVTVPRFRRPAPGLLVHRERLFPDDITSLDGVLVTSPACTGLDLARWKGLAEGVVAVDALARIHRLTPGHLRAVRSRYLGKRGNCKIESVLSLVDPRAESPMESRMRVALVLGGLPPTVQHPVIVDRRAFRLDLAYPSARLGVEYDGGHHRTPEQALRDLDQEALLATAGWKVVRFRAGTVLRRPGLLVGRVRDELHRRGQ